MGGSVISSSVINEEHVFLPSALLLLLLLSVSFVPACPLSSFFSILDSIFCLFYWCFSLTLFKVNQNIESLIKGSVIVGAGAGGGGGGGVGSSSRGGEGALYQDVMQPRRQSSCGGGGSSRSDNNFYNPFADRNSCSGQDRHSFVNMSDSALSPLNDALSFSPLTKSPWIAHVNLRPSFEDKNIWKTVGYSPNVLIGSLVREEGHIYSLAASGDLLYTGSDSKNIRVWKNQKEFSGFKSHSGLVKAIVIAGDKILSGHQDGKIRIWKVSSKNPSIHKRVGTLPTFKDYIKNSMKPGNYVEVRRHKNTVWLRHFDAISCLRLSEDQTLLYPASWDKTFKVWRISDSKCIESVTAHDDAVNSLVVGWDGLVFTGSADGTVKVWRRELQGKGTKHFYSQTLLKQECAVTALAVNPQATHIYSGSSDGVVNFWQREMHLASGGALRGHKLAVLCLVTAGNLVFSGSADMGICVWRRMGSDHICLSLLMGHTGPVKCLAAEKDLDSPPGKTRWTLYSGSLDKSVKMWRVSEDAPPMD